MGNIESTFRAMWREVLKHRAVEACGGKCVICKGIYPDIVYQFHHINPAEKDKAIFVGNVNSARTWNCVREELKKVVLVCPTCHSLIHYGYIANPTESSFDMNYYEWDIANNSRTPRQQLFDMTKNINSPKIIKLNKEIELNEVENKHFRNDLI